MSRQLSERETVALKFIGECSNARATGGATGNLADALEAANFWPASAASAHRTAAALCRKNLAYRAGTHKLQWYRITQIGRDVLESQKSGLQWRPWKEGEAQ